MKRRSFIKNISACFGSVFLIPEIARAIKTDLSDFKQALQSVHDEKELWDMVRRQFLLNPGIVHLNTGSCGSTPRLVLDAVSAFMYRLEGNPVPNVFGEMGKKMELVRKQAAAFLNADLEEVALTRNTTEGMNAIATGLGLKKGDEVLTTNHEHPGGFICWEYIAKHVGIKIKTINMPAPIRDTARILQLVKENISPRTRVCSFSHVCTITGLKMPMAKISEITHPRNIFLICDGAQSPGMLNVDVKALKVDTFASSSHKWMLAPKGCGLLYIRKEVQDKIQPVSLFSGYNAYSGSIGTRNVPQILGHGVAMEFHNSIGRQQIENRCLSLSRYLRERLQKIPLLEMLTSGQDEFATGITTYRLKKGSNKDIANKLKDSGFIVKLVPKTEYNALRFSTHIYNTESEIDRLAETLLTLI